MSTRAVRVGVVLVLLLCAWPSVAQEQVGVRAGISGDPDQFVFGGHIETAPLLERLVFRPNAEVGIGNDLVLIAINLEFAYKMPINNYYWTAYVGAGPALNIYSFDRGRGRDDTETEGGFNILIGAEHDGGLFAEFKVGASDGPDLKLMVGYSF